MSSERVHGPLNRQMQNNNDGGGRLTPALLGAVVGPALQVQQPALWGWPAYVALLGLALSFSLPLWGRVGVGATPRSHLLRWKT